MYEEVVCFFVSLFIRCLYMMFCAIYYHFYNLKNVENTQGGVLLLVACNSAKSNTPPWVFFTFFKLYKWYNGTKSRNASYQCIQGFVVASQQIFTCLKSTVEILEKGVEYVQR